MEAISPNDDGNGEVALTTTKIRIMMMSIAIKKKRLRLMSFFWSQHVNIYEQGAEIDSVDNTSSTPLLLAASKGSWDSVLCLIQHGADIYSHDQNSRNFLHLAIRFGGKLHEFGCSFVEVNTYHLFFLCVCTLLTKCQFILFHDPSITIVSPSKTLWYTCATNVLGVTDHLSH